MVFNSLIIQWQTYYVNANEAKTILLAHAYTTTSYVIELTYNSVSGGHWTYPPYVSSKNTTQFTMTTGSNWSKQYVGIITVGI